MASIQSVLIENETILSIEYIQKNPIAFTLYSNTYHFGTALINELLINLQEKPIKQIVGNLSWTDACKNWNNSISFYYNLPLYLSNNLKYKIIFHLYDEKEQRNELLLSHIKQERVMQLNSFIDRHNLLKEDASFSYTLLFV